MQQQNKELDESTSTFCDVSEEDGEELNFEANIREAYEEIIDNIEMIRDTLSYFRQSKRNSLQSFEFERLHKLHRQRSIVPWTRKRFLKWRLTIMGAERKGVGRTTMR